MNELTNHLVNCYNEWGFFPYVLEMRVSHKCNLNCIFCPGYEKHIDNSKSLPTSIWKSIIKAAVALGIKECLFFSDLEPLMHKDALDLMIETKKHKLLGKTTTGILLSKKICANLVRLGWDEINLSLEGHDPETNDYIRGKGVFKKVCHNLMDLKKIKTKLKKEKPRIMFNTVFTNRIYTKIDKITMLAHVLGVSAVNFHPLSIWNQQAKKLELKKSQYKDSLKYIEKAHKLSEQFGIHQIIFQPLIIQTRQAKKLKLNQSQLGIFASKINDIQAILEKYGIYLNIDDLRENRYFIRATNSFEIMLEDSKITADYPTNNIPCFYPWWSISILHHGSIDHCTNIAEKNQINVNKNSLKKNWYGNYFNMLRNQIYTGHYSESCKKCKVCTNRIVEIKKAKSLKVWDCN